MTNFHIRAVPYKDDILIFGGHENEYGGRTTLIRIDRKGRIVNNFKKKSFVPLSLGRQPFIIDENERIFTVVRESYTSESIWMFDGTGWLKAY